MSSFLNDDASEAVRRLCYKEERTVQKVCCSMAQKVTVVQNLVVNSIKDNFKKEGLHGDLRQEEY